MSNEGTDFQKRVIQCLTWVQAFEVCFTYCALTEGDIGKDFAQEYGRKFLDAYLGMVKEHP